MHMCVEFTSKTSRPTVNVFDTGAGLNIVRTSFLPVKWQDLIGSIHNMFFKSALNSSVRVKVKLCSFSSWPIYTCLYTFEAWKISP